MEAMMLANETADVLSIGCADKTACEHEWWEEMDVVYTSNPPCHKQVCRLCGEIKWRYDTPVFPIPKWKRV